MEKVYLVWGVYEHSCKTLLYVCKEDIIAEVKLEMVQEENLGYDSYEITEMDLKD